MYVPCEYVWVVFGKMFGYEELNIESKDEEQSVESCVPPQSYIREAHKGLRSCLNVLPPFLTRVKIDTSKFSPAFVVNFIFPHLTAVPFPNFNLGSVPISFLIISLPKFPL